jgi:hypothetical protein
MAQWLAQHWFEIVQTLGIAGSLFYAGQAFDLDRKMRRTEMLLSLTEAHRSIWARMIEQPELARVLDPKADISVSPPTAAETRFVKLVLLHLSAVHGAIRNRAYHSSPEMDQDVRQFLNLPIPRSVLVSFLRYQGREFREYVGTLLDR